MARNDTITTSADRATIDSRVRAGALVAAFIGTAISGCGSDPVVPQDPAPVLGNFVYEVEAMNVEVCPTTESGLPANSTVFRWSVDYSDSDGDVGSPIPMGWQSQFHPGGSLKEAVLLLGTDVVTGDGFSGTITLRQCVHFEEQDAIRLWVSIVDGSNNQSELAFLQIDRPAGALVPAPGD